MDFSIGPYYISNEFKNKVEFSYFHYDHFALLTTKPKEYSFFNFEDCGVLESIEIERIEKVKNLKKQKHKKVKKFKKIN